MYSQQIKHEVQGMQELDGKVLGQDGKVLGQVQDGKELGLVCKRVQDGRWEQGHDIWVRKVHHYMRHQQHNYHNHQRCKSQFEFDNWEEQRGIDHWDHSVIPPAVKTPDSNFAGIKMPEAEMPVVNMSAVKMPT